MNYWIIYNGIKMGPMSLEQVRAMALLPDTPVWHTGLPAWVRASDVPELGIVVRQTPPPATGWMPTTAPGYASDNRRQLPAMPPTYLAWSIVCILLCCMIPGIVALVYSTRVEPRYNSGDYEGARRASQTALLWIIAGVVLGLVAIPFQILYFIMAA
ncbi:MAG: CD225/dispanin family protein [Muribaculaceae bacterium]|nr:CD225/dispanin family protein [Muribaculaceae bacterium]